jgi:hypothetical protein
MKPRRSTMTEYYSEMVASSELEISPEQIAELERLLEESDEKAEWYSGIRIQKTDRNLYTDIWPEAVSDSKVLIYSDESCSPDLLSSEFLKYLGTLIKENNLRYLEFGIAYTSNEMLPKSHGGYAYRVDTKGNLHEPTITWPEAVSDE